MPLSRLNDEQYKAATAKLGYNLVIASAGTGKTSTIVARIAHLLNSGINPAQILLLTFTNKASGEMIERVSNYFDKNIVKSITAGTFHSVSYRLLKKNNRNITLKQPKELKILLKSIYEKRVFHHIESKIKPYQYSYLYDIFSLYQNSFNKESFSRWLIEKNPDHEPFLDIYEDILEEFTLLKKKYGYVDYNDLLINIIQEAKEKQFDFKEILVDEYQDTNKLQGKVIDAFNPSSLFCVGDYDQSIYAFNGADINIIASFKTRYKNADIYSLNKNYRSTKDILSLANRVIAKNPRLYEKELIVTKKERGYPPKLLVFGEVYDQYEAIAKKIKYSQTPHEQIAVIFRNNSSADGIEVALRNLEINCKRKGSISFFDTKEIKALLNLLSILTNPKDIMAFVGVFEYARGIGSVIGKEIFEGLIKLGDGDILKGLISPNLECKNPYTKKKQNYQLGLFDNFDNLGSLSRFKELNFEENFLSNPILKHPKISTDGALFIYELYKFVKSNKKTISPYKIISNLINSALYRHIADTLSRQRASLKHGGFDEEKAKEISHKIISKAWILANIAKNYNDMGKFLNALVLGSSEMSEGEGVNLLSVHGSKGLEFKEVYIVDLMDGRFPNKKLMSQGGSLEEERRLFYVATTRAKEILYLSYARYDKIKKIEFTHSPFLEEAGMITK